MIYVVDSELWINLRISKITWYFQNFLFHAEVSGYENCVTSCFPYAD